MNKQKYQRISDKYQRKFSLSRSLSIGLSTALADINQFHIYTIFADPIKMMVQEGKQISLDITAPTPSGHYQELRWYKGSLSRTVAFYHHELTRGVRYFDGYCSTNASPCFTSDTVKLDVTSGRLTFYNINVTDEDNYYYKFYGEDATDTGYKYEIQLFVYSKLGLLRCF